MQAPSSAELQAALDRGLDPSLRKGLAWATTAAEGCGLPCYLVGGPVRDLLLQRPVDDLDLVIEGDALAVAERFAADNGGKLTRHGAFGTASVELALDGGPIAIDFVTARADHYPEPATLPVVRPSTIEDDLRRRD